MKLKSLAAALLLPLAVLAQPAPLLSINDPEGDDVGDGDISYPRDSAFAVGDLDLRTLRVFAAEGGLRFEAAFANAIRDPASARGSGLGSEDLSLFARRGFYSFNLDIYLDTDRVRGSGSTATLPGRHAVIDAAHAWDKAIVLTPRPELMRRQLHDALAAARPAGAGDVGGVVDGSVFFPTEVRVRGRTVSFFVPQSFLGGLNVGDWSLTALVTAAKLSVEAEFALGAAVAGDRQSLGAQQPQQGRPLTTLGHGVGRVPATAVVDLLAPDPRQQAQQLAAGAALTGLSRENRFGAVYEPAPGAAAPAPVATPAFPALLQPAAAPAVAARPPSGAAPLAPAAAAAAAAAVTPAAAPPVVPAAPAAAVPALPAKPAAAPAAQAPAPAKPRDAAFFEEQEARLRTLKRLREAGLISEDEYQQKRRQILDQL